MTNALRRFVRAQQFDPGWAGPFLNPFFLARRSLWHAVAMASPSLAEPLLDVGCGTMPYRQLFAVKDYIGLDIDSPATRAHGVADALYDGTRFPFPDGAFRGVLCNQVLEHVFTPDSFVAEIRRVLQPGGKLLLTVPFVWDEHDQPHDFARYSSFGLNALLLRNGMRVVEHRKLMPDVSVIFQLLNAYIYKVTLTRSRIVNLVLTALVMAPISIVGLVLGRVLPSNPDLFLDQLVIAEKIDV